jgi:hypothetical protein
MSRVAPFAPRSNLAASLADRVVRDVRSWDLYEAILACRGEASRGVEPDECYEVDGPKPAPDLAIEVVWTHGGIDKLSIYRAFGVREVWSWIDGRIDVHALRGQAYERIPASELFPDLDLAVRGVAGRSRRSDRRGARAEGKAPGTIEQGLPASGARIPASAPPAVP